MSEITSLPQEWRTLAALDARIASGNLSSAELTSLSDELVPLFYHTSARIQKLAKEIFNSLIALKGQLLERDLGLVTELHVFEAAMQKLSLRQETLTPEELAEELVALEKNLDQLKVPFGSRLRGKYRELHAKLERLQFGFVFPIVSELEPGENTFASELTKLSQEIEEGEGL